MIEELLTGDHDVDRWRCRSRTSTIDWKPLVEVADLDKVLGYKGNYAIYRAQGEQLPHAAHDAGLRARSPTSCCSAIRTNSRTTRVERASGAGNCLYQREQAGLYEARKENSSR